MTPDEDLLVRCDSLLSLIRHREARGGLTEQTISDLDGLLPALRRRTDEATRRPQREVPDADIELVYVAADEWAKIWCADPAKRGKVLAATAHMRATGTSHRHQRDLLGQALGRVLTATGAMLEVPASGPELLMAAEDYVTFRTQSKDPDVDA